MILLFFVIVAIVALCMMVGIVGVLVVSTFYDGWIPGVVHASACCCVCATLFFVQPSLFAFWSLLAVFLAIWVAWYRCVFGRWPAQCLVMRWKGNDNNG